MITSIEVQPQDVVVAFYAAKSLFCLQTQQLAMQMCKRQKVLAPDAQLHMQIVNLQSPIQRQSCCTQLCEHERVTYQQDASSNHAVHVSLQDGSVE